ncbi:MAG: glucosaminidase domain-containing protein, partial [Culicoidibacterales bacterium]
TEDVVVEEESEVVEPEAETEDVVVEEESEVVEPEAETEDVVVEEESEVVEPETEDVVVEDTPMLYSVGETGRTPYEKTPVETTDVAIQTFGVEQVNEFALGQVSSYVDPSVVADKQAAIAELEALTPQSPQPYEVAVVNEANEYFFIEGQPTYEDAVALTQTIELFAGEEAVVINENGMVTYSNSNVARVFKTIDGKLYYGCDINTTLYRDASLGTSVGYINQCYTDDVSVLAIQGDAAKIMVAGKVAWLRISSDLVFVSTNQIANPSYYANENGHFVHYISKNLTTPSSGGTKLELGPKNNKLQDNVKYYSYDGNYFYTNPETIGPDMNDGVANSAVNANDPYYNYFQNLPFNSKAVATAAQIDAYINANTQATSKLRNTGQAFIDAQNKYGINALLMLGIAINESNWGMSSIAQSKNNLFGLNAVDATPGESADYFPTVAACIDLYASDWLAQGYADPQDWRYYGGMLGNKSMGANVKYASDAYWSEKAVAHMYTVDRGINGGTSKEWNYYSLGWFTAPNSVKSSNGQVIYPITAPDSNGVLSLYSSYTNTPIILKETNASDGKYEVWPARNNTLSSSNNVPASLPYNWNGGEYISTSGV